jgi:hypothetical protein
MNRLLSFLALAAMLGCSSDASDDSNSNGTGGTVGGKFDHVGEVIDGDATPEAADAENAGGADVPLGDGEPGDGTSESGDSEGGDSEAGDAEPTEDGAVADGDVVQEGDGTESDVAEVLDPWAQAKDVTIEIVTLPEDLMAPEFYDYPTSSNGFSLGGTEFWQKWYEGLNPTYSYSKGTEFGRRCMSASARRFEALVANPPPALMVLRETSDWSGSFFNWNDDYSDESSYGSAFGSRLWAWRTSLVKFISQTAANGDCYLPTYDQLEQFANNCLQDMNSEGEIQGCSAN